MGVVNRSPHSSTLTGWREWVSLPDLPLPWVKAKIDTGARTSALHAADIVAFQRDGASWVRFRVPPWQDSDEDAIIAEFPVHDRRLVRSSSGHASTRYVVLMDIALAGRIILAEVTLSSRSAMDFRMLIGREVLQQGFLVDTALSFCGGRPPRDIRRRNRGR